MKRRFNVVDVILLLLAAAVGAGVFLLRDRATGTGTSRETAPMRCTVEFLKAPHGMAEAMRLGDDVYRSTDGAYMGKLVDFSAVPHRDNIYSPVTGRFEQYDCQETDDVYMTIEGECYSTGRDIVFGTVPVKIGAEITVKGRGYAKIGYIIGIDTMGAAIAENRDVGAGDSEAVYSICFTDARMFYADNIHVGDRFYEDVTGSLLGVVQGVRVEPYGETWVGPDGEAHRAEKKDRYNVIVELKGRYVDKPDGYYLDGGTELKTGAFIVAQSQYIERQALFFELVSVGEAK